MFDDFNLKVYEMFSNLEEQNIKPNIIFESEVNSCIENRKKSLAVEVSKNESEKEHEKKDDVIVKNENVTKSCKKSEKDKNCTLKKKEENYMKIISSLVKNCMDGENIDQNLSFLGKKIKEKDVNFSKKDFMLKAISSKKDSISTAKKNKSLGASPILKQKNVEEKSVCRKRTVCEKDILEEKIQEKLTIYDKNLKKSQKEVNINFNLKDSTDN